MRHSRLLFGIWIMATVLFLTVYTSPSCDNIDYEHIEPVTCVHAIVDRARRKFGSRQYRRLGQRVSNILSQSAIEDCRLLLIECTGQRGRTHSR